MFRNVAQGPPDPVYILKNAVDNDKSPQKVDLGVGVYRNEQGGYHELGVLKQAKEILRRQELGHDYEVTTGDAGFVTKASHVLFGQNSKAIKEKRVVSVQAISGTGSIHLAALFLSRSPTFKNSKVYVGTPAWGNYEPLFGLAGLQIEKYRHYDPATGKVDFASLLKAVDTAPESSIFILQGCCHNPSGADLTKEQWDQLAPAIKKRNIFPLFDMAYQGLGNGVEEDAYGLRLFESQGFELAACQSFSKNFGLYGERVGVCHLVVEDVNVGARVYDQLRCLIRWEFSSSPAYGSRLVTNVLGSEELQGQWNHELASIRQRLVGLRRALYDAVTAKGTPGNWEPILTSTGLFCFLPLTPVQCSILATQHHVYMLPSGRINIAGLNASNIAYIAAALDEVVRGRDTSASARL